MKRDFMALEDDFDLLVVGGGIYGAWMAWDAALRGLKVALVEQGDWACGTSSASSKLIHGGLRYLETFDFRLVRKALRERQRLLRIASHRVWPLRFGVPVYDDSRNGRLKLKVGLMLYDRLGGASADMGHRYFSASALAARFPFLAVERLKGGFTYGDAQTDDARLVLELVAGALAHGAVCVSYARVTAWQEARGRVCGVSLRDEVAGGELSLRARQVVDTRGQWQAETAEGRAWCRLSKGVHLVLPALGGDEALLLTAPQDGRVFFLIPWYGRTLLGTTDTDFDGDVGRVEATTEDEDYLLAAANHYLRRPWSKQEVVGRFAGLRVMRASDARHPSAVSRDWVLHTAANGVHHSIGGKLTSAREDAREIVDTVCAHLGMSRPCLTAETRLPWYASPDELGMLCRSAQAQGVDEESADWLVRRHGCRTPQVLRLVREDTVLAQRIVPEVPLILADLLYCARHEMVLAWPDLIRRRLPLSILARLDEVAERALAERMSAALGRQIGPAGAAPGADF